MSPSLSPLRSPVPPAARFSGMRLTVRDLSHWHDDPAANPYESLQSLMVGTSPSLGDDEVLLTFPGPSPHAPQQTVSLGGSSALTPLMTSLKTGEPFHKMWEQWLARLTAGDIALSTSNGESQTLPNGMSAEAILLKAFETVIPVISGPHGGERKEFNGPGNSWRAVYLVPRPPKRGQREQASQTSQPPAPAVKPTGFRRLLGAWR